MKVTLLLRVPFLDKIPNLKTLVVDLAKRGFDITIISAFNENYPVSDLSGFSNVKMVLVKQRTKKFELPTSAKLLLATIKNILFSKSIYYIGGDNYASHLLMILKKYFSFTYINFILEYPDINKPVELNEIEAANYIITHDHWHAEFISKYCKLRNDQILFLPNSSYTDEHRVHNNYLAECLQIPSDKNIILHSGGLGKWFCSKELAKAAMQWSKDNVLVFHTSHIVEHDSYFQSVKSLVSDSEKVFFSTKPVTNEELDRLVASAKIGIALYSLAELGYRAENMGLAAGKIGNYLKCGIPVIATKVHSLSYLEDYQCGILVDNPFQIIDAINVILQNYDNYAKNSYTCYNALWHPKKYLDKIYETFINK
ncbi:Glycosyltransferase involved in cell wall bisynthesis [Bacteroides faecichinchillae]|uniref:Glycosyltransferase involved in cell wall bisynthesis n=1 Tax=Bacteroides faecichinchillae TaxID=871325 RepID=A0A1M5B3E8_9BACE|nr:hypothetical protein [Bacteroides faecichinchillae]SHF36975.1 Glycosyltransferase involved in cell wall bisynthesis [Bacteroides faecichinchillae]